MKEIRKVYCEQLKNRTKRWVGRIGIAYGLMLMLMAASGVFSRKKAARES